jgi:5-methylcytosine-specific restriction enzyme subunit McrC
VIWPDPSPVAIPAFQENDKSEPFSASLTQCDQLARALPRELRLEAQVGRPGWYCLAAGPVAGVVDVGGVIIEVRPKLPVARLLFLLGYALDRHTWRDMSGWFHEDPSIVEAIGGALARQAAAALARGPLRGYIDCEGALNTVRGRIRFDRQVARWYGQAPPIEVSFTEFTDDILEHRLIKAAVGTLLRWPLRQRRTWELLRHVDNALAPVTPVSFQRSAVPFVRYTRLNQHYRPAVELARLVLRLASFETFSGRIQASGLLVNMNDVFQDFVEVAFREALAADRIIVRGQDTRYTLDTGREVRLRPDLVFEYLGRPVIVGDAKYKRLEIDGLPNADVYQALAYAIALRLPMAVLVYPAAEAARGLYLVPHAGVTILVRTVNLSLSTDELLVEVGSLAAELRTVSRVPSTRAS